MPKKPPEPFTKADTVALWHAVGALAWQVRSMPHIEPPLAPETIEAEKQHLYAARRALHKANAIRAAAILASTEQKGTT